jgi:hypothetical protein
MKSEANTEIESGLTPKRTAILTVSRDNIVITGKYLKVAQVQDEAFTEGEVLPGAGFDQVVRDASAGADLFTFIQKIPATEPRYDYHMEWTNLAVIESHNFRDWWENKLPQVTRKNVRRAGRRGVVVRPAKVDEAFVNGITEIYNEIPIRDGRPFRHFGKTSHVIEREMSTMPDRSHFLGAYCGEELVGFLRLIDMGQSSSILHLVCKRAHYDRRPSNALVAAAVEYCSQSGSSYLIYGQYHYGNRSNGPLTEFKRRNGFSRFLVPRYFIPLTFWGRVCLSLRLHQGISGVLPTPCVDAALAVRSKYFEHRLKKFLSQNPNVSEVNP